MTIAIETLVSADAASTVPAVGAARAAITVDQAEQLARPVPAVAEKPFSAAIIAASKMTSGEALRIAWVAEPGDEAVLLVAHDPARITRDVVDYLIAHRYGVPAEIVEADL